MDINLIAMGEYLIFLGSLALVFSVAMSAQDLGFNAKTVFAVAVWFISIIHIALGIDMIGVSGWAISPLLLGLSMLGLALSSLTRL